MDTSFRVYTKQTGKPRMRKITKSKPSHKTSQNITYTEVKVLWTFFGSVERYIRLRDSKNMDEHKDSNKRCSGKMQ